MLKASNSFSYLPLGDHKQIIRQLKDDLDFDKLTITRLDLCCDPQIDYPPSEKVLRLLVLMLADKIEARNRYLSVDPITQEVKTIRIEARKGYNGTRYNSELQVEHYNRALLDQSNWDATVVNRLEFRASGTEAGENHSIEEIIERWINRLKAISEPLSMNERMQKVECKTNKALIARWQQLAYQLDSPAGKAFNDFVFANLNYIFTRRQLLDLFKLYGDDERQAFNRAKNIRRERRKAFKAQLVTEKQFVEEVQSLISSIEAFIRN